MFNLIANEQTLILTETELLVSRSVNVYHCLFSFDESWDGMAKTAIFRAWGVSKPALLDENNHCIIPPEVLTRPGDMLLVGIQGIRDEVVFPTVETELGYIHIGANLEDSAVPLVPSMANQLLGALGDLSRLTTAEKRSLVDAINSIEVTASMPEKGVDYFTEEEKAEMVADVIAALPTYNGEVAE